VNRELPILEEIEPNVLVRAGQITRDNILRHYRSEYHSEIMTSDHRFDKHFNDLAEVAKEVYDIQQYIKTYEDTETFSVSQHGDDAGFLDFNPPPKREPILDSFAGNTVAVNYSLIPDFLQHLSQDFPRLDLNDWKKVREQKLPEDVFERLKYLKNSARFNYCPACEVCKDLMA